MTATAYAQQHRQRATRTQTIKDAVQGVNWDRVTHATFFGGLGLFWICFAFLYAIAGGWYWLFAGVFAILAIGHFGVAMQTW